MTAEMMFSQGAFGLVLIALGWFGWRELWPYYKQRDTSSRDHQQRLDQNAAVADQVERDRRHELEQRQIETDGLMASALTVLADAVRSCPTNGAYPPAFGE